MNEETLFRGSVIPAPRGACRVSGTGLCRSAANSGPPSRPCWRPTRTPATCSTSLRWHLVNPTIPSRTRLHASAQSVDHRLQAAGRARRRHRRPLHARRKDRRRRHGRGLGRQADRAGQTQGRAQADQDRHGFQGRAAALRAGAAGAGDDGSSQHRPGARRRPDARPASRSSSWSWSTACR